MHVEVIISPLFDVNGNDCSAFAFVEWTELDCSRWTTSWYVCIAVCDFVAVLMLDEV